MTDKSLNGQQISAMQAQMQAALSKAVTSMDLRKYAMQMVAEHPHLRTGDTDMIQSAQRVYDFLTAPAADVKVTIE